MKFITFLAIIFIIFFSVACSSRKPITQNQTPQTSFPTKKETKVDSIYDKMKTNQFQTDWFSGKFSGTYQTDKSKQSFDGQIRIKKDSIIWISVSAVMNIEVFRLVIRPDSFFIINKLQKQYTTKSIDYFKSRFKLDIDFYMLQAVLMGNDFPYYETNDVFKLEQNSQSYHLSTLSRRKIKKLTPEDTSSTLIQNIWIDKNNYKITKQNAKIVDSQKAKLNIQYSNFINVDNQLFPSNLLFLLKEDDKTFLQLDFSKIITSEKQTFPFHISKNYKESDL